MYFNFENTRLSRQEILECQSILQKQNPKIDDDLHQIWYLMDKVWDEMGCDNQNLDWEKIGQYYSHPIWMLNGLFIENHDLSIKIRKTIAAYIAKQNFTRLCDWGGGFGTLAREISKLNPHLIIDIYEPYPSEYGKKCIQDFRNISFVDKIEDELYDCLVTTDVLEHLDDPLHGLSEIYRTLKKDGIALIGHCFYPVIKCHLPKNFHYRYSFNFFAKKYGFKKLKRLNGAEYINVFQKTNKSTNKALNIEKNLSKIFYSVVSQLEFLRPFCQKIKHAILNKKTL